MHLYCITRGIKDAVDACMNDLQAQFFPFKVGEKDHYLQLSVRPIQLWELVMPEPALGEVCKTLWDDPKNLQGQPLNRIMLLNSLRMTLGAKPLPDFSDQKQRRIIRKHNVAIYPVGIKPDLYDEKNQCEQI